MIDLISTYKKYCNLINKIILITLVLLLLIPVQLFSQSVLNQVKSPTSYFDLLTFRAGIENKTRLEIYSEIPLHNLNYRKTKNGYHARYRLSIKLFDQFNEIVHHAIYSDSVQTELLDRIYHLKPHIIKFSFIIEPGDYRGSFHFKDFESFNSIEFDKKVLVPDYHKPEFTLSDLQLSYSIAYSESKSELVKNNWKIDPNVSHIFYPDTNTLFVYCELYNLGLGVKEIVQGLISTFIIINSKGEEVKSLNFDNLKFGDQTVLVGKIPISELQSNRYQLQLKVTDLDNCHTIENSTVFNLINSGLVLKGI